MPFQYTFFTLAGGGRCVRLEWSGVVSGEDAAALLADAAPGKPLHGLPMLIITERVERLEPEARGAFGAQRESPPWQFQAAVVTNPILRVATNFMSRVTKNPRQRMFAGEAEALKWLDERTRE